MRGVREAAEAVDNDQAAALPGKEPPVRSDIGEYDQRAASASMQARTWVAGAVLAFRDRDLADAWRCLRRLYGLARGRRTRR